MKLITLWSLWIIYIKFTRLGRYILCRVSILLLNIISAYTHESCCKSKFINGQRPRPQYFKGSALPTAKQNYIKSSIINYFFSVCPQVYYRRHKKNPSLAVNITFIMHIVSVIYLQIEKLVHTQIPSP